MKANTKGYVLHDFTYIKCSEKANLKNKKAEECLGLGVVAGVILNGIQGLFCEGGIF